MSARNGKPSESGAKRMQALAEELEQRLHAESDRNGEKIQRTDAELDRYIAEFLAEEGEETTAVRQLRELFRAEHPDHEQSGDRRRRPSGG